MKPAFFCKSCAQTAFTVWRNIFLCPCIFRREGRTNCSKETIADTGLPGRPNNGTPSMAPNASGLPGRMATCQKCMALPISPMTFLTKSKSPTETPPEEIIKSAQRAVLNLFCKSVFLSLAIPSISGIPPHSRTCAARE